MIPKEELSRKAGPLEAYALPAIILLVGLGAFGLGRLSAIPGGEGSIRVIYPNAQVATPVSALATSTNTAKAAPSPDSLAGKYVASKNGTKYYLTTCSASNRIKPENKVYFVSKDAAEAAGYEPAANCPGL
jgi:hypothetical protein